MKFADKKLLGAGIVLAAFLCVCAPENTYAAVPEAQMDGVMGQSIEDETELSLDERILKSAGRSMPALYGASGYSSAFLSASFTDSSPYTGKTYYHRNDYEDYNIFHGIDVSWWQGGGKNSYSTKINWEKAHDDGIDFTLVRAASRDTADGSIYEDTCANAHIQGALENDVNVGLYIFSQALTQKEAREEADYLLMLIDKYGWDITMPIVIDREPGNSKRLTAGMLSKTKETGICQAFADVIHEAGYEAAVYSNYTWFKNYIDGDSLDCDIWFARYNTTTTSNTTSGTPYADVPADYTFWQYTSTGVSLDGYASSSLDMNFWYKDTSAKTTGLKVKSSTADSITLTWSAADDAQKYRVYRYDDVQEKYVKIAETTSRTYTDNGLDAARSYKYKVRGCWEIGGINYYGAYSSVLTTATPLDDVGKITADERKTTSLKLKWKKVDGADGYIVYQYSESSDSYEQIADVTGTSHLVTGLSAAKTYRFKICPYMKADDGTVTNGKRSAAYAFVTKPSKAGGLKVTAKGASSVKLTWKKVSGANGYAIYRLNSSTGNYKKVTAISNGTIVSYTDTGLSSGTKYTYKIRAYIKDNGEYYYGSYSDVKSGTTKPGKVKSLKLKTKSSAITLNWGKVKGASGYQVYRLNNKTKKYEKIKTVKGGSKLTYKNTNRKKNTTYTYKVRAYRNYDGKTYYGSYSSAMKIKAK